MRTALFIFSILFSVNSVFAQLYVNDSYVFNKGTVIYVKDYVELNTVASNIYLRSEGQLLQGGTTVNGLNRGVGNLSVFQEGTANNFGFNYWCSPVGVGLAAAGNNPFSLNPILYRPTGLIASVQPIFTGSYNGSATDTSLAISTPWIYEYQISSAYGFGVNGWNFKGETGTISSGLGFTMKGVTGTDTTEAESDGIDNNPGNKQRYDFKGKPNDGTINIPVAPQIMGTQYPNSTLTGNPYPSAINLNLFLLENSGYSVNYTNGVVTNLSFPSPASGIINGNAYFWEHEKPATSHILVQYIGGYGFYAPNNSNAFSPGTYNNASWNTYNVDGTLNIGGVPTGTERYKRMFSPVGQGFMIEGTANGNAQMKNSYRVFQKEGVLNNSEFNKNSNAVSNVNGENWDEIPNVAGVDYTQFSKASVPQIKIYTTLDNQFTKEVTLAFNQNTTDGFDTAMDVAFNENKERNLLHRSL